MGSGEGDAADLRRYRREWYDKIYALANHRGGRSRVSIENEVAKCEIVCANCHRERTWQRKHVGE
jgi:hypothetical protein